MFTISQRRTKHHRARVTSILSWLAAATLCIIVSEPAGADEVVTPQITIDQFGWLPGSGKGGDLRRGGPGPERAKHLPSGSHDSRSDARPTARWLTAGT